MNLLITEKEFTIEGSLINGKKSRINQNSGNNEWYTPSYIIEAARNTMGSIDLDPASSAIANQIVMAKRYYNKEDNGLIQPWYGNIWLNPPYSRSLISQFSSAVTNKRRDFNQAIVLVNNATETLWFDNLTKNCCAMCFLDHRIKFTDANGRPGGSSMQGQIIIYFGTDIQKFKDNFSSFGHVWEPCKPNLI
jgi:ParB family chromosome partitioning protein